MSGAFRIGFDLDGVLADLGSAMEAIAARLSSAAAPQPATTAGAARGTAEADAGVLPDSDSSAAPGTAAAASAEADTAGGQGPHPALTREIWREIRATDNFWETLGEIEQGAVARLAALADEHRWEVVFLTQRPPTRGDTTQRQSQRWLAGRGFSLPSVCVVAGSRGKVAEALGLSLVVDDRPENCVDVVNDSKATAVLIWRGGQHAVARSVRRLGVEVADSVTDCLDRLAAGFITPGSRDGLAGRLKRWIDPSTGQPE